MPKTKSKKSRIMDFFGSWKLSDDECKEFEGYKAKKR